MTTAINSVHAVGNTDDGALDSELGGGGELAAVDPATGYADVRPDSNW